MHGFEVIIDSHTHWGPSISMGTTVSTGELKHQQIASGVTHVIIMPFPSTAIESNAINQTVMEETQRVPEFIPYHYIREEYEKNNFDPIPEGFFGGKWHWMRGVQDVSSNYGVLEDPALGSLIQKISTTGKPVIFEEELSFTKTFVEMFPDVTLIIPHLGLLGGDPLDFLKTFRRYDNLFFDTALASYDTIIEFENKIGAERLLFGSDVPFGSMKTELSKIIQLPIPDVSKAKILSGNIRRLARLPDGLFSPGKNA
ncbi:MAG TPA: amidohydrolase family protein [Syntrophorhabdaceae bacterium]|nr:amidohydrolase family protein [Syntrophorhabdaceae bacterium]